MIQNGILYLHLAGNLQTDANHLCIFFDTSAGGQNPLRGDNDSGATLSHLGLNGGDGNWGGAGMRFDNAFAPGYCIALNATCSPGLSLTADFFNLPAGSGGSRTTLGSITSARGNGNLSGGTNPNGIRVAIDNSNTGGVTSSTTTDAGNVNRGVELAIPLAALGNPAGAVKICAIIADGNYDGLSNQVLGPLQPSATNYGHGSFRDFQNDPDAAGNQYFLASPPCTPVTIAPAGQPVAASACSSSTAQFTVTPSGDAPFAYQWRNNGSPISDGAAYSGTAIATLSVLPGHNGGSFDCVVTNCSGTSSVTSTAAMLQSLVPPATRRRRLRHARRLSAGSVATVHLSRRRRLARRSAGTPTRSAEHL